ncbi:SPOR domain-containing protein [Ancylobacter pratisalsi]|nr:SPOR domain-containing protein [Ancylobacter pratisalsi]
MRNRQDSPAEDPLAELARLMGQEDEFAEILRKPQAPVPQGAGVPGAAPVRPRPAAPAPSAPPRAPLPPRPAAPAPRPATPPPSRPAAPNPFSGLAAELRTEPRAEAPVRAPLPRSERSSLEDTARDLSRSLRTERPAAPAPRAPEPRAPEPRPAPAAEQAPFLPPRPRPTEPAMRAPTPPASRGFERSTVSDGAADAISRALSEPFDLGDELGHPEPRADAYRTEPKAPERPLPAWMARGAADPAPAARAEARPQATPQARAPAKPAPDFDVADDAYDYGRSALEGDSYEPQEGVDQTYEIEPDEAPPRRGKGRLVMIGGLVVVAVVATAGVYAYMSGSGGSSTASGEPPVIRADQGPNKVVPAQPTPDQAGEGQKLIYDRVGGSPTTGNEKVVSSEEQPVDMSQAAQPQPRVIQTAPGAAPTSAAPSTSATDAVTEPKRVRTLTVRADGTIVEDSSPSPMPSGSSSAASSSVQPTASTPIPLSPGSGAPVSTDPTPISNTPSIVPNVPLPPTRLAANPMPAASSAPAATSAPAPAGAYVVQIASVRSEAEAQATWKAMQAKYPGVLGNQQVAIRRADLGDRGIYYRTQVGNFSDRDQANNLCQALRAEGGDCMVQRN